MPPQTPNNQEIDQALKEFEAKSGEEHPVSGVITPQSAQTSSHKVEGVSFDTDADSYKAIKFYEETATPKMVKAVMKLSGGVVKSQRQAEWLLFGFVIIAMGISVFLLFKDIIHFPPPTTTSTDLSPFGTPQ